MRWSSAKGPFFKLRPMKCTSFHNEETVIYTVLFSVYFLRLRSRTMYLLGGLLRLRVLYPSVGLPHGETGDLSPIGDRPSPPPCGRSTRFIADLLTDGRVPYHRERPALPSRISSSSLLQAGTFI